MLGIWLIGSSNIQSYTYTHRKRLVTEKQGNPIMYGSQVWRRKGKYTFRLQNPVNFAEEVVWIEEVLYQLQRCNRIEEVIFERKIFLIHVKEIALNPIFLAISTPFSEISIP